MSATYNFSLKRGDTFGGLAFTVTDDQDAPIAIDSGRSQIRKRGVDDKVVHLFTCTISGAGSNIVTISPIDTTSSQNLSPGTYDWDLELTLADGRVRTWVSGTVTITGDITR